MIYKLKKITFKIDHVHLTKNLYSYVVQRSWICNLCSKGFAELWEADRFIL